MKFLNTYANTITGTLFFVLLFSLVVLLQKKYDVAADHSTTKIVFHTETRYVMPSSIVKNFSFGFRNVLADFYWVSSIQDFSIWDGKDPFYLEEYKNISAMDPKFGYPYLLGILTFASRSIRYKEVDGIYVASVEPIESIANIGMENLPDSWEIPFYLGTAFQLTKVPDKALYYLKIAAEKPDAPDSVRRVYDSYIRNIVVGDNASRAFIKTIYETTDSKTTKKILRDGVMAGDLTKAFTVIVKNYKKKYGVYPQSVYDLIQSGMIHVGPELLDEFDVAINKTTGVVKVTAKSAN